MLNQCRIDGLSRTWLLAIPLLWFGTAAAAQPLYQVKDINPSLDPGGATKPTDLAGIGAIVYFAASDALGSEPWRSDGTPGGTFRIKDVVAGAASSNPKHFTDVAGTLFFTTANSSELWKSDGT